MVHAHVVGTESVSDPFVSNGLIWMCVHKHRFLFSCQPSECDQKEIVFNRWFSFTTLSRVSMGCAGFFLKVSCRETRGLFSPQVVMEIFRPGSIVDKHVCQLHPGVSLCFLLFARCFTLSLSCSFLRIYVILPLKNIFIS